MAGVARRLTGPAVTALICLGIFGFALLWMWLDFRFGSHVWTITPGPILILLAMVSSVPVFLGCCIALARRKANGLPVFMSEIAFDPASFDASGDPLSGLLASPPPDAQVKDHRGRRVIVLADGSVVGEMLTGRVRRFSSLDEYRAFVD